MLFGVRGKTAFIRHSAHLLPGSVFRLRSAPIVIRLRLTSALLAAAIASLALAASASAALIGLYRNSMESDAQRGQIGKLSGERCGRGGSSTPSGSRSAKRPASAPTARRWSVATSKSPPPDACSARPRKRSSARRSSPSTCAPGTPAPATSSPSIPLQRKAQLRKILSDGTGRVPAHREGRQHR